MDRQENKKMTFGKTLLLYLIEKNISLTEIATKMKYSKPYLSMILNDKRCPSEVFIKRLFKCISIDDQNKKKLYDIFLQTRYVKEYINFKNLSIKQLESILSFKSLLDSVPESQVDTLLDYLNTVLLEEKGTQFTSTEQVKAYLVLMLKILNTQCTKILKLCKLSKFIEDTQSFIDDISTLQNKINKVQKIYEKK